MHWKNGTPCVEKRAYGTDRHPHLADGQVAEFGQRLEKQYAGSRSHAARHDVARAATFRVPRRARRVDQHVGVERADHPSCISSRVKLRSLPRQGRPFAITVTAWSMAA